jgi:hypothetical protein
MTSDITVLLLLFSLLLCYYVSLRVSTRYFKRLFNVECPSVKQGPYSWYVLAANAVSTDFDIQVYCATVAFARQQFGKHISEVCFFSGVGLMSPGTAATSGLLYSPK